MPLSSPAHQDGRTRLCFYLEPSSPVTCLIQWQGNPDLSSKLYLLSEGEGEGKRTLWLLWVQNRALMPSPPPRESTTLRGALTPPCILINIIPPSINSKSACFTPGEKNNPRLVSPASPGAAEGLNTPWLSATSFSLGAVDRVWCSLPWRWLWHQKVAARERGRMGWAG